MVRSAPQLSAVFIALAFFAPPVWGDPPGGLDPSFNRTGILRNAMPQYAETVTDIAIQADGKILAAGHVVAGKGTDAFIARFTADGRPDATFNKTGFVIMDVAAFEGLEALALQPDGKIVGAGSVNNEDRTRKRLYLCRLNADGSADVSFNKTGSVLYSEHGNDSARGLAIAPGGRIIVGGGSVINGRARLLLCAFSAAGALDRSFGTNGAYVSSYDDDVLYDLALQPDGRIVAAGAAYSETADDAAAALFRFTAAGKPDAAFNKTGRLTTGIARSSLSAVAVGADGKIIGAGSFIMLDEDGYPQGNEPLLLRVSAAGVPDDAFNAAYFKNIPVNIVLNLDMISTGVALAPDGKVLVCSHMYQFDFSVCDVVLSRYTADGVLDKSFGGGSGQKVFYAQDRESNPRLAVGANGAIFLAANSAVEIRLGDREDAVIMKIFP